MSPYWRERHNAFHAALVAGCSDKVLLQVRTMLCERAERYRHLSVRCLRAPRDDRGEHEAMMQAELARDAEKSEQLLKRHILRTTEILLEQIDARRLSESKHELSGAGGASPAPQQRMPAVNRA